MKNIKFSFILIILLLLTTSFVISNYYINKSINFSLNYSNMNQIDNNLKEWISNLNDEDINIARYSDDKFEIYYLYINNQIITDLGVSSNSEGLIINAVAERNVENDRLFSIKTENHKVKYIELNGRRFNISDMENIE